ncbi:MAG: hypothetical protein HY508_15535 [Acidobacteria bacterium]|nr:hypothetical protein [Acidobacteriota bacterium]
MKRYTLSLAALALLSGSILLAGGEKAKTFKGEIMDSQCAMNNSHEKMEKMANMGHDPKMCTLKCVEMGGKFVLQDTEKNVTYMLDDQEKPRELAGQKVTVTGTYDKKTKTIHVERIEGAS